MSAQASPALAHAAGADEVVALVRSLCRPLKPERVPLEQALGRMLREPVCAPEDQPAFDRSAMDGFAVRRDDPGPLFRVVDEIRAGDWKPRQLQTGEAVRIATGGALPGDGLQVVMKEDAQVQGTSLRITRRDEISNIRCRGEDARQGHVLVPACTRLEHGVLGLMASIGYTCPLVSRRPRVVHVVTGNEIVPPDQRPAHGQIRDSNSTLVRAFLQSGGNAPRPLAVKEDAAQAEAALRSLVSAASLPDLLLISGGASVGEHDFTRRLLESLGYTICLSKANTRPGKPLIVAQQPASVAFGLPGNPLAHFVCLNLYVRVALEGFAGRAPEPLFQRGTLAAPLASDGNARETFWPALAQSGDGVIGLTPLRWSSSGDLTSFATANALMRVPAGCERLPERTPVEFLWTVRNS